METGTSRKWQCLCVVLLLVIFGGAYYSLEYVPNHAKPGEPILFLGKYVLTYVPIETPGTPAYVIPARLEVWNTPAEVRVVVGDLSSGMRVYTNDRFRDWVRVRFGDGKAGWVNKDALMDSKTYEAGQRLRQETAGAPPQAEGHVPDWANLHISPSRDAPLITELNPGERVKVYGRRLVERGSLAARGGSPAAQFNDVWYLVRAGSHAGWVLGRLVQLDIPAPLANYAEDTNVVAWFVLDRVNDSGREIPQYLVADREGTESADFTHIRVMTWWQKKQHYVIAYVDGGLRGYFPIIVTHEGTVPYFCLRLIGAKGQRFQKTYGLFNTMTRVVDTVAGWQVPAPQDMGPLLAPRGAKLIRASYR